MQDDHNTCEPTEPDETQGAAGEAIPRRRLTIGARAHLLMGLAMGTIVAVTVLPGDHSWTVSHV